MPNIYNTPEGSEHFNKMIIDRINQTLNMKLNPTINITQSHLEIKLATQLELFFLENYIIDNIFGHNYNDLNKRKRIIQTNKSSNKILIYNRTACQIFFNHISFREKISLDDFDNLLQNFEDGQFIYVKTKSGRHLPVVIISNIPDNSSIYNILLDYYQNAFRIDRDTIEKMLSVTRSSDLDKLVKPIRSLKEDIYVVYHPFYDRTETSNKGDSYKKIFTVPGDNEYGEYLMKSIYSNRNRNISRVSTAERLKLKKNLDKMF